VEEEEVVVVVLVTVVVGEVEEAHNLTVPLLLHPNPKATMELLQEEEVVADIPLEEAVGVTMLPKVVVVVVAVVTMLHKLVVVVETLSSGKLWPLD